MHVECWLGGRRERDLWGPRRRWEDDIGMDLGEVGCDDGDWIGLARDRDRWRAYETSSLTESCSTTSGEAGCSAIARQRTAIICQSQDYRPDQKIRIDNTETPPYSPELAPCDYHLFGKLKDPFAERETTTTVDAIIHIVACTFSGPVATRLLPVGNCKGQLYQNILTTPDDMQQRIRQACVSIQPATCRAVIRYFGERLQM
ncbi:hypothetical protein ANN_15942 [Periplaneta americana]|uniref:Uncharacterized protein n=1 Tax=Periplaneta americana TaxID=6978 RepID=A0ABQ8SHR0_PERAM|nr:hypothetical protein ANN_15942 [Periplaneta americana]